jgi:hypothetical protein
MKSRRFKITAVAFLMGQHPAWAQDVTAACAETGGMPLMQALKERKSSREFSSQPDGNPVEPALGRGENRPDGHRTAPSARIW